MAMLVAASREVQEAALVEMWEERMVEIDSRKRERASPRLLGRG